MGYSKNLEFRRRPTTLIELRDNITEQIDAIQLEMLQNAMTTIWRKGLLVLGVPNPIP